MKILKEYLGYFCILVIVLLIKWYVVSPIKVNGSSMATTLHDGDIMLLDEISYRFNDIKRFDIVVLDYHGERLIKRVIGLPGEKIEYKDNVLYIDGKIAKDNFTTQKTKDFVATVGKDEYFVLGDNRNNSIDSRVIGSISRKYIKGKTKLTLYPFDRLGDKK